MGLRRSSATGATLAANMSEAVLEEWGWRIPFLIGLLIGIAGYFLRRHVSEIQQAEGSKRVPIVEAVKG